MKDGWVAKVLRDLLARRGSVSVLQVTSSDIHKEAKLAKFFSL